MSTNDQFDELARRKLAERDFPFQEAHWLDAQRAIAAQGQQRRGGAWMYIAGAAALIVAIWLLWPTEQPAQVTEENNVRTQHPVEADAAEVNEEQLANPATTNAGVKTVEEEVPVALHEVVPNVLPTQGRADQQRRTSGGSASGQRGTSHSATVIPAEAPPTQPEEPIAAVPPAQVGNEGSLALNEAATATGAGNVNLNDPLPSTGTGPGPEIASSNTGGTVKDPELPATSNNGSTDPTVTDPPDPTANDPTSGSDGVAATPTAGAANSGSDAGVNHGSDSTTTHVDPTASVTTNDTTTTLPVTPVVVPLITPRSPWELTLLGGLFNTSSTYSGANSASWSVDPQHTTGFGAEYMHMGRNVGMGGGIHYGSYADRLRTPEESRSVLNTTPAWYLQPVDTTILIITGSYTDSLGIVHYTGQNIDVTINELRATLDSTYANTVIRQAMERVNRTSYVEAVGLVDAHLVQGRWTLGVRVGPSIGLLTEHRGAIPSGEEGYTEFADLPMKTVVAGWTARAYVRYRFNAAWSVGIEPAARGQFNVAFDQEGVTRRSSALGCMLSLTYRLR